MNVAATNLKSMSLAKLSKLKEQVEVVLKEKVAEERRTVEDRLNELDRLALNGSRSKTGRGGVRGSIAPKYRNPDDPNETWAGRGLKPRWLVAALKTGKKLEEFSIDPAARRGPAKPRKARATAA
jgi:DNA-binding protein H-NS